MHFSFQNKNTLYLVMDLLSGGDLRYHMGKQRKFSEYQIKFFCACVIVCLEFLFNNKVIHRDIKPENLVFDKKGYLRVTDFGIARTFREDNASDTSGTPGYMCPEVMLRQNHSYSADYFALGVIAYELLIGKRPYQGKTRKEIRDAICTSQVQIRKTDAPYGWSLEGVDFINKMIQRKTIHRLGQSGIDQIKNHPWFRDFPWNRLAKQELQSPFVPQSIDQNLDFCREISSEHEPEEQLMYRRAIEAIDLRRKTVQAQFDSFNFDPILKQAFETASTNSTRNYSNAYA